MVSPWVTAAFLIAFAATTLLPIVLLIVLCVKKKLSAVPVLFGFGTFMLSQMVLRMPLLNLLSAQSWFQRFAADAPYWYLLVLAFSAGLFEESFRLGGAVLLRQRRTFRDAVSFGLGHGLCEVVLLTGLTQFNNALLSLLLAGGGVDALAGLMPAAQAQALAAQLAAVAPLDVFAGLVERVSAVLYHVFAAVLIVKGVAAAKGLRYTLLAIGAHTVFNLAGVLIGQFAGVWPSEAVLLALALLGGWYLLRQRAWFAERAKPVC